MEATVLRRRILALIFVMGLAGAGWAHGTNLMASQHQEPQRSNVAQQASELLKQVEMLEEGSLERSQLIDDAIQVAKDQEQFDEFFGAMVDEYRALATSLELEKAKQIFPVVQQVSQKAAVLVGTNHGRMWLYHGTVHLAENNYLEAVRAFRRAEAYVEGDVKEAAKVQSFLGISLIRFGAPFQDSANALRKCIELAEEGTYSQTLSAINLTRLYLQHDQFEKARAIMLSGIISNDLEALSAKAISAELELHDGNVEQAMAICNKSIEEMDQASHPDSYAENLMILSQCYDRKEEWSESLKALEEAYELTRHPEVQERILLKLGKVWAKSGDIEKASEYLTDALESSDLVLRERAAKCLIRIYDSQPERAYRFAKIAIEIQKEREQQMIRLAETEYQPQLDLASLKLVLEEETANTERERMKASSLELKSATYRTTRNWSILGAILAILGSLFLFRTEGRRREAELLLAESQKRAGLEMQLEQKKRIEAVGQLTGNVAHDFNNVLQVVAHTSFLIKESLKDQLTVEQEALFESSTGSVEIGANITQQLLTFAKKQVNNPQVAVVSDVLDSSKLLFGSVGGDALSVNVEYLDQNVAIDVDRGQFSNAILNLLINAKDALDGKGTVDILVSSIEIQPAQAAEWQLKSGNYVRIDVVDGGRGMTMEQQENACEPFFTTKSPSTGTGLGLSSVKGFVEQANGAMKITSERSEGTTVSLVFPECYVDRTSQTQKSIQAERPESPQESIQTTFCSCLVVEDNNSVRESLELMIKTIGYDVQSCSNADLAKGLLLERNDFQIVISDICMPGKIDGLGLAEWIVKELPDVKVILVSGNEAPAHLYCCQFLRKPFRFKELVSALESAIVSTNTDGKRRAV